MPLFVRLSALLVYVPVVAAACGEPSGRQGESSAESLVAVREVFVGRSVDAEGAVTAPADSFAPGDSVYVSMVAEGNVERAVLTARWTRGELLVTEEQQVFPLSGRMTVTFALAYPEGLPAGEHRVEIRLGESSVASETFEVASGSAPERGAEVGEGGG